MPNTLRVQSCAFPSGGTIPVKHTADGANVSPPLEWSQGPAQTVTYAVIVDDPDAPAGTWVHWILWNQVGTRLDEGAHPGGGAVQGRNSWGRFGWGGPQPPSGVHRYFFRVYALDARLELGPDSTRADLERAMRGHVLATGELMGRYEKKKG